MNVSKLTLGSIFEACRRHIAPLFQRPYVWTEEGNWEPLWDSIQDVADRRLLNGSAHPHFLGAIVLDQLRTSASEIDARQLIDGQQRLTTLQLVLAAVRDVCQARASERYFEAFKRLTVNYIPSSIEPDLGFKVWPTNVDRTHFQRAMTAGSPDKLRVSYQRESANPELYLIPAAYTYFFEKVNGWLATTTGPELEARLAVLYAALRQDMNLVVIDLDEDDDAQEIFETLNALGTPLLPADLVKNYLFHAAELEGKNAQEFYEKYWRPFDEEQSYWREQVGAGRLKRPRIDLFLQHYLTLMTGEEVSASHLFSAFRDYARNHKEMSVLIHLQRLHEYAGIYASFEKFPAGSREELFFYRLRTMETGVISPLLLEVFKNYTEPARREQARKIIDDVESFLVRRTVCGLSTKSYNRLVIELVKRLKEEDQFSGAKVREYLLGQDADSNRWPTDEEFEAAWINRPLYRIKWRTRMVLEALELALKTSKTENFHIEKLTIEHLMPQVWEEFWPLDPGLPPSAEQRREAVIHTIGNLTLLTAALNPAVSNGPWEEKRREILAHSALNLNRPLQEEPEWNEERIARRATELFRVAKQVWHRPPGPKLQDTWKASSWRLATNDTDVEEAESAPRIGIREARRKYWSAFKQYLSAVEGGWELKDSAGNAYYRMPSESRDIRVYADMHDDQDQWIGIYVVFRESLKQVYERIKIQRANIEIAIGAAIDWEDRSDGEHSLNWYIKADRSDVSDWPRQFGWIHSELEKVYKTILPLVVVARNSLRERSDESNR